ncbi:MAG: MBL fold metallo-hydrolase [Candidatus Aenigmatarchaeota archaeon]
MVRKKLKMVDALDNIYVVGKDRYGLSEGSCFLIDAEKNVLLESGNSLAVRKIAEDLSNIGVQELDYIMLTHIHMDHSGGAGFLLDRYPDAEVVVHESGSEHLVDPTRLKKSVEEITGKAFKYFGDIKPIPDENIVPVTGGERFDLGAGHSIQVIYTPGHAPHHTCYYERKTKSLAVGDVAGRYYPEEDMFFPTTPPPNFDLEKNKESLSKLKGLDLDRLFYSHKGWTSEPYGKLSRYENLLEEWVNEIEQATVDLDDKKDIIEEMTRKYRHLVKERGEGGNERIQHIFRMNTEGVLVYLEKRDHQSKR